MFDLYEHMRESEKKKDVPKVYVKTIMVPETKWFCPYCNEEMHEKSIGMADDQTFRHNPCFERGPIDLPPNPSAEAWAREFFGKEIEEANKNAELDKVRGKCKICGEDYTWRDSSPIFMWCNACYEDELISRNTGYKRTSPSKKNGWLAQHPPKVKESKEDDFAKSVAQYIYDNIYYEVKEKGCPEDKIVMVVGLVEKELMKILKSKGLSR